MTSAARHRTPDTGTGADGMGRAGAHCTAMNAMQEAGLGPLAWLGPVWAKHMGALGRDVADFVAERIRDDVNTQQEILRCRTWGELQDVQTRFLGRAFEDYAAETGKLLTLGDDVIADAAQEAQARRAS